MSRSVKKTPVYRETSEWRNQQAAKHSCNKAIRHYCTFVVMVEYTEDGDPYPVYEEGLIMNRSNQKKIGKTKRFPRRVYDGNLDIENAIRLKKRREFDELRTLLHLIVK